MLQKTIILLRSLSLEEQKSLKKTLTKNDKIITIENTSNSFQNMIVFKTSPEFKEKIITDCFNDILEFPHLKTDGKTINDNLFLNEIYYWYYFKFTILNSYIINYTETENLKKIIASIQPQNEFTVYSNTKDNIFKTVNHILPEIRKSKINFINLFSFGFTFFLRFLVGIFQFLFLYNKKNIIVKNPLVKSKLIDPKDTKKTILGDINTEYLTIEAIKKTDFAVLSDVFIPNKNGFNFEISTIFNNYTIKSYYFELPLILTLCNPMFWAKFLKFNTNLKKGLSSLNENNINPIVLNSLTKKKKLMFVIFLREQATKTLLFLKPKIKTFTLPSEYDFNNAPIFKTASIKGRKTIAIQHGTIHDRHMLYMYIDKDINKAILPTSTIVWGKYWGDTLIKKSIYTKQNIQVLGQARTDVIPLLNKKNNRKYSILYLSNGIEPGNDKREILFKEIMNLCIEFPSCIFSIRPHPNEFDAKELYNSIASDMGVKNYKLDFDDLYYSLNNNDLILNYYSTAGGEAVYFKKPVILMDYNNNDVSNFGKYTNVFYKVANYYELVLQIKKIKEKEHNYSLEVMNKFIEDYANKIDGKTVNRYIKFIYS